MDNLEEMDKFLETHNLLRLNQEEIDSLNRPITRSEIELVITKYSQRDFPGGPVVKNLPYNAGDAFDPWSGN